MSACHDRPVSRTAPTRFTLQARPLRSGVAVSRRAVLRALGLAGFSGLLAGCGLRWESDAPDLPLLPRDRHPGAEALRGETALVEAARAAAAAAGDGVAVAANTDHLRALTDRLVAVHDIPAARDGTQETPAATAVTPAPEVATPAPAEAPSLRARAARAEWAGLDPQAAADIAAVADAQDLLLLASVQVSRLALGRRFGGRWSALTPTDGIADVTAEAIPDLLATARRTAYVLDVCAARATPAQEPAATASIDAVARIVADLAAAARRDREREDGSTEPAIPPPPLGYPLDLASTADPEAVADAAATALASLSDALVAAMPQQWARAHAPDGQQPAHAAKPHVALRRRAAECEQWHTAWNSQVRSLPGLR